MSAPQGRRAGSVPEAPRNRLGLPVTVVLALAVLAVPRVFAHDAGLDLGPVVQVLLTFGPPAVWVYVALRCRVPSPLVTLVAVGTAYGVLLGAAHLLMWDTVFGGEPPRLGGALTGDLSGSTESAVVKGATVVSSVFTGAMVGLMSGAVAQLVRSARRSSR